MRIAAREGVPILPRGGGTSLAGQAVGEALILHPHASYTLCTEIRVRNRPAALHQQLCARLKTSGKVHAWGADKRGCGRDLRSSCG
ncbi:MAG: FAD-binding oxidoreductase [Acidobacteria bacterium]|nr:MAG: FAD-binding oxidoreductase [Acidobacteriota bacterium]